VTRRAAVVVLDACGIGALPDAEQYGDAGAHTLGHLARRVGGLRLPHLQRLGLGSIDDLEGVAPAEHPVLHGTLSALGPGKDSAAGHWELMGAVASAPLPTYPAGFPPEVLRELERATGRRFCANVVSDGMQVLEDFGEHHLATGELILYTSVDSVLQVAGHEDVLAPDELHRVCAAARGVMQGDHAVGRVIARPFAGAPGAFERVAGRRDFAVAPPAPSALETLAARGSEVHAVGKVADLFAGAGGVSAAHPGSTNAVALQETTRLLAQLRSGLVFTNLVETDQVFGHRKDVEGFHRALQEIDAVVGEWLEVLGEDDLLVLTADHGVDPDMAHADHTRERVPLLAVFAGHGGRRHDGAMADVGQSVLTWLTGEGDPVLPGRSFV